MNSPYCMSISLQDKSSSKVRVEREHDSDRNSLRDRQNIYPYHNQLSITVRSIISIYSYSALKSNNFQELHCTKLLV